MLMYDGMQKCWGSTYRQLVFQKTALMCNGCCRNGCVESIDWYYNSIVQCLITASNSCIPIRNFRFKKNIGGMMNWTISKTNLLQLPRFGTVSVAHEVVRLTIIDSSGSIDTHWPLNKLKEMLIRHLTMNCLNTWMFECKGWQCILAGVA